MSCDLPSVSMTNDWLEKLKILVPQGNELTSSILGGAVTGRSIIYTFTSSSSSSDGRTTSSFGAVGDHLGLSGSTSLPRNVVAMGSRNPSTNVDRGVMSANSRTRSPLADLVNSSTPDEEPYQLLALGQVGPLKQPFTPQLLKSSDLRALTRRRRSLSDLKDAPQARQLPVGSESRAKIPASLKVSDSDDIRTDRKESLVQSDAIGSTEVTTPPVWSRKGLPFDQNRRDLRLDPETFSLPLGVCRVILSVYYFVS